MKRLMVFLFVEGKRLMVPPFTRIAIASLMFLCLLKITGEIALAQPPVTKGVIAFTHGKFDSKIYVINADGTQLTQLTHTDKDSSPSWSPDGAQLVFASGRDFVGRLNVSSRIYVMNADGTGQRPITDGVRDGMPDWSPDGQTIAFVRQKDIFLMNPDGSNQRRLTMGLLPTFSPDGKKILFVGLAAGGNRDLHVINIDGTGLVRIPNSSQPCVCKPSWSPNGRWIALTGFEGRNQWEIYRMNVGGANLQNLTNHPAPDGNPAWSPDNTQIAFSSSRDGRGIYVMNADGTGIVKLTPIDGFGLDWYAPRNLAVTPRQKQFTTWGRLKRLLPKF